MRYCAFSLVFAMLTVAIGCQGPLHQGGFNGGQRHPGYGGPAVGPGAVPPYFAAQMGNAAYPQPMGGMPIPGGPGCDSMTGNNGSAANKTSQIQFNGPDGMLIYYDVSAHGMFDSEPISCPGIHNFRQGEEYRLKISNIPTLPGRDLYPTIAVAPAFAKSQAFLSHNMIPIVFTDNDFDQVESGNFITKVIYLPNPEFQGLATAGVGTLVNTQLEPGVDPIIEAENRGTILAVVRIGNKDLSAEPENVVEFSSLINEAEFAAAQQYRQIQPPAHPVVKPVAGVNVS
ncbi:MAG: hypothetical protein ACRC2T_07130, partial [Thermoguttaceae bacterium]